MTQKTCFVVVAVCLFFNQPSPLLIIWSWERVTEFLLRLDFLISQWGVAAAAEDEALLGSLSEIMQALWEMKMLYKCISWCLLVIILKSVSALLEHRREQEEDKIVSWDSERENLTDIFWPILKISTCQNTIKKKKVSHFTVRNGDRESAE